MNFIKLIISLILFLSIYTTYEDCMYFESEITIKNYYKDADGKPYTKNNGDPDYKDTKLPANLTFIASKADDCKNRKTRPYSYGKYYYDSQKDDERTETFQAHCCYITYDGMDKYVFNKLEYKYDKDKATYNSYYGYDLDDLEVSNKEGIKGMCIALTDLEYDNIKHYITNLQLDDARMKNLKIDCNSYNLKFFILNLILLFLL